jgi:ligand-binding sensor domain-containing protein
MPPLSVRAEWAAALMKAIPLFWLAVLLVCPTTAGAQTDDLTLRQLNHRVFAATDGAPADIVALAQTTDGTLWIGGRTGLARFDGMHFVPYPGPSEEPLRQTNISALFAAPDGSLWIGFRPSGVAVLKHGQVTRYGKDDGVPDGAVQQFALDRDGALWMAARLGVARFAGGQWTRVASEPELNTPYGVLIDRAGTLWVATVDGLRARRADEDRFREVDTRQYFGPRGLLLTAAPDGKIWAAAGSELVRLDRSRVGRRTAAVRCERRSVDGGSAKTRAAAHRSGESESRRRSRSERESAEILACGWTERGARACAARRS